MGAAFGVCFSYWLMFSVVLRFGTYLLSVDVDFLEVSSLVVGTLLLLTFFYSLNAH